MREYLNSHELVRIYILKPRNGFELSIGVGMPTLIADGFPDNMDDLPSMNFLRKWKIMKVKNLTMNSVYL